MEVKIGIQHIGRELVVECSNSAEEIESLTMDALAGRTDILSLTDAKGNKTIVPASKIAYLVVGSEHQRPVGFGTA